MNKTFKLIFLMFFSLVFNQEHFELDINETAESSLFIFLDSIQGLESGDELGIFDSNGVIDTLGNIGEILVGVGVWNNNQLEIVGIHSLDFSQFGGPILPGAVNGNPITLKVWKTEEEIEYTPSYNIESGTGTFDGLFTVIAALACPDGYVMDECGICGGPGQIYECGCYAIPNGECDCNGNINDCSGICNGNAYIDQCGVCDNDVTNDCELDCSGIWGGGAVIDECGICDGPGAIYQCGCIDIQEDFCDCNNNILDCTGGLPSQSQFPSG